MNVTVVRYRTKTAPATVSQTLVASEPSGLQPASFRLANGVSFVRVAASDTPDGSSPLLSEAGA